MGIQDDDIERLRSTVSIVDTIQQYVALKRVGRNWVGLCPFHAEKSGSFNVREETGRYKCFGCQAAGDVFGLPEGEGALAGGEAEGCGHAGIIAEGGNPSPACGRRWPKAG